MDRPAVPLLEEAAQVPSMEQTGLVQQVLVQEVLREAVAEVLAAQELCQGPETAVGDVVLRVAVRLALWNQEPAARAAVVVSWSKQQTSALRPAFLRAGPRRSAHDGALRDRPYAGRGLRALPPWRKKRSWQQCQAIRIVRGFLRYLAQVHERARKPVLS